jgi:PAS domain-containing protein
MLRLYWGDINPCLRTIFSGIDSRLDHFSFNPNLSKPETERSRAVIKKDGPLHCQDEIEWNSGYHADSTALQHGVPTMTEERKYPSQISITDPSLQIILDASPVGMVVFDHEARVIYANTLAEQVFGTSVGALIGNRCGDFIACHHRHSDPRGCGKSEHCPACPFYRAIQAVLEGNTDLGV